MQRLLVLLVIIIVCLLAFWGNNKNKVIYTSSAPTPIGPYSQAILSGGTLYVSGQIGLKLDGMLDTSSIENECRQALANVKAIIESAGMQMSDVKKSVIYMTDLKNFSKVNDVYKTYFSTDPPARETVEVKGLPKGAHVEISVIAD